MFCSHKIRKIADKIFILRKIKWGFEINCGRNQSPRGGPKDPQLRKLLNILNWVFKLAKMCLTFQYLLTSNVIKDSEQKMTHSGGCARSSYTEGHLLLKDVFHQRSSYIKGHLQPKVVFHQSLSSNKGVLNWKLCSTEGCPPPKVIFHRRMSSTKVRL